VLRLFLFHRLQLLLLLGPARLLPLRLLCFGPAMLL
jgi:hypothetical protein